MGSGIRADDNSMHTVPTTRPLPEATLREIKSVASTFAARWNSFEQPNIHPSGDGEVADLLAHDACVHEPSTLFETPHAFYASAAAALGNCLQKKLGFEWCEIVLASGAVTGVRHPFNRLVVPLEAAIVQKLSGKPQYEGMAELFIDIYLAATFPDRTHFADELRQDIEESEYEERWGFRVPPSVRARLFRLWTVNRDCAVRGVGVAAFDWTGQPDWDSFQLALASAEQWFAGMYREAWPGSASEA